MPQVVSAALAAPAVVEWRPQAPMADCMAVGTGRQLAEVGGSRRRRRRARRWSGGCAENKETNQAGGA